MGAPHLSPQMEEHILLARIDLKGSLHYEPSAKQVRNTLINRLKQEGYPEEEIPKIRTIQQRLKTARKRENEFQVFSKVDESQPWSMLTLNIFPLPPESIPSILQQWRYSINLDVTFTIRQAKWTSRLYPLFREKDVAHLWFEARRYSREEKLSILSDNPMKIYQLDSRLVMGRWERYTAELTDINESLPLGYVGHTLVPLANDGGIAEEFIHALPSLDLEYDDPDEEKFKRIFNISHLIRELPSSTRCFPDFETRMVYLRHLSYISKMPKWNTLEPIKIRDTILRLRKLVISLKKDIEKQKSHHIEDFLPLGDHMVFQTAHWKRHKTLFSIYKLAGRPMKEGSNERSHN